MFFRMGELLSGDIIADPLVLREKAASLTLGVVGDLSLCGGLDDVQIDDLPGIIQVKADDPLTGVGVVAARFAVGVKVVAVEATLFCGIGAVGIFHVCLAAT